MNARTTRSTSARAASMLRDGSPVQVRPSAAVDASGPRLIEPKSSGAATARVHTDKPRAGVEHRSATPVVSVSSCSFTLPEHASAGERIEHDLLCRLGASNPFWLSEQLLRRVERHPDAIRTDRDAKRNPHYQLGLLLAPAYIAFARHVVEQADQFDRVYFLSREGWMFMRLYHRLAKALGVRSKKPKGTYLVTNRKLSFLASMQTLSINEIARFWRQYPGQNLHRLLRNLSLPEEVFLPLAAEHGLTHPHAPIHRPYRHERLNAFVADPRVQRLFAVHRDAMRNKLLDYLAQRGFFDAQRVALVDIGWKGSIQTNLHRAASHRATCPAVHGIYFGLRHDPAHDAPGSTRHGFFCDSRTHDWTQQTIFRNDAVFEMFATAPHGSASGYSRDERGWVHAQVQAETEEQANFQGPFRQVRAGIEDWFNAYLDTPEALASPAKDLRPAVLERLRRYILYPTSAEANAFLDYSHVENFGIFCVSRFHFQASKRQLLRNGPVRELPYRFVQALRRERWPEGVCKRSRIPFATFLFDLIDTRKYTR